MAVFTSSQVGAFPTKLTTSLSLDEISAALVMNRPNHSSLAPGWGGPGVTPSELGMRATPPPVSDPVLLAATSSYPERLHARYYFFVSSPQLRESYGHLSDQEQHVLAAIDVLVSKVAGSKDTYLCVFSSRNSADLGRGAYKSFQTQVVGADTSAQTALSDSHLNFEHADVFFWMLTRTRDTPDLDVSTKFARVEAVAGQDNARRLTSLSKGVDFDRPAFLVAVADNEQLGPIRVKIQDKTLKARFTIDLWTDGSFKLVTSKSGYRSRPNDEAMRASAVNDLIYTLLPKIRDSYRGDKAWSSTKRDQEVAAAIKSLVHRYQAKLPKSSKI